MSAYYLCPITSQQLTIGGQTLTVNAPAFLADLNGATFTSIPYGAEPICILALAAPSTALAQEAGVYAFPDDLSQTMSNEDVATLKTYLNAANVPSGQIVSGAPFVTALVVIAKIFLLAQWLFGQTTQPIFGVSANAVTLSSPISSSPAGAAILASVSVAPPPSLSQASQGVGNVGTGGTGGTGGNPTPLFNFSTVSASTPIGTVLDTVSQQFTGSISLGGF